MQRPRPMRPCMQVLVLRSRSRPQTPRIRSTPQAARSPHRVPSRQPLRSIRPHLPSRAGLQAFSDGCSAPVRSQPLRLPKQLNRQSRMRPPLRRSRLCPSCRRQGPPPRRSVPLHRSPLSHRSPLPHGPSLPKRNPSPRRSASLRRSRQPPGRLHRSLLRRPSTLRRTPTCPSPSQGPSQLPKRLRAWRRPGRQVLLSPSPPGVRSRLHLKRLIGRWNRPQFCPLRLHPPRQPPPRCRRPARLRCRPGSRARLGRSRWKALCPSSRNRYSRSRSQSLSSRLHLHYRLSPHWCCSMSQQSASAIAPHG